MGLRSVLRNTALATVPGCCVTAVKFWGVLPGPGRFLTHRSTHCHDGGGTTIVPYGMTIVIKILVLNLETSQRTRRFYFQSSEDSCCVFHKRTERAAKYGESVVGKFAQHFLFALQSMQHFGGSSEVTDFWSELD